MIDVIISTVKWFDQAKGYGFIECELGDVFVHYSEIKSKGFKTLKKGDKVKFELCKTEKGLQAKVVTLVESGNQNADIINNHNN